MIRSFSRSNSDEATIAIVALQNTLSQALQCLFEVIYCV